MASRKRKLTPTLFPERVILGSPISSSSRSSTPPPLATERAAEDVNPSSRSSPSPQLGPVKAIRRIGPSSRSSSPSPLCTDQAVQRFKALIDDTAFYGDLADQHQSCTCPASASFCLVPDPTSLQVDHLLAGSLLAEQKKKVPLGLPPYFGTHSVPLLIPSASTTRRYESGSGTGLKSSVVDRKGKGAEIVFDAFYATGGKARRLTVKEIAEEHPDLIVAQVYDARGQECASQVKLKDLWAHQTGRRRLAAKPGRIPKTPPSSSATRSRSPAPINTLHILPPVESRLKTEFCPPPVWLALDVKEDKRDQTVFSATMAGCMTDFHQDQGGRQTWTVVLSGRKDWLVARPTESNVEMFKEWFHGPRDRWLGDVLDITHIIQLPGDQLCMPAGWIHAVYTSEDTVMFGGSGLSLFELRKQAEMWAYEKENGLKIFDDPYKLFRAQISDCLQALASSWHYGRGGSLNTSETNPLESTIKQVLLLFGYTSPDLAITGAASRAISTTNITPISANSYSRTKRKPHPDDIEESDRPDLSPSLRRQTRKSDAQPIAYSPHPSSTIQNPNPIDPNQLVDPSVPLHPLILCNLGSLFDLVLQSSRLRSMSEEKMGFLVCKEVVKVIAESDAFVNGSRKYWSERTNDLANDLSGFRRRTSGRSRSTI